MYNLNPTNTHVVYCNNDIERTEDHFWKELSEIKKDGYTQIAFSFLHTWDNQFSGMFMYSENINVCYAEIWLSNDSANKRRIDKQTSNVVFYFSRELQINVNLDFQQRKIFTIATGIRCGSFGGIYSCHMVLYHPSEEKFSF